MNKIHNLLSRDIEFKIKKKNERQINETGQDIENNEFDEINMGQLKKYDGRNQKLSEGHSLDF